MSRNYIASDYELMIDMYKSEINFLKSSWQNMLGRPIVTIACRRLNLGTYIGKIQTLTKKKEVLLILVSGFLSNLNVIFHVFALNTSAVGVL